MTFDSRAEYGVDLSGILAKILRPMNRRTREAGLQSAIGEALMASKIRFAREVVLSPEDRIDFVVFGDRNEQLALEVKVSGSLALVTRQLHRYAQHERFTSLMLVTTRSAHLGVPREFNGKKIDVLHLVAGAL